MIEGKGFKDSYKAVKQSKQLEKIDMYVFVIEI